MRWSSSSSSSSLQPVALTATLAILVARGTLAQSVQGEPTLGATSIPVTAAATTGAAHPGEPTVGDGSDSGSPIGETSVNVVSAAAAAQSSATYNDGMYTPWTPTDDATAISAIAVTSNSPISATVVTTTATPTLSSTTPATTTVPTTPPSASSTSTSSTLSTSSTTSSSSSSSSSSSTVTSTSSSSTSSDTTASESATASPISDQSNSGSSNGAGSKLNVVLPVAISLGTLAVLLALLLLFLRRRKMKERRMLDSRRYTRHELGEDDPEKGGYQYGSAAMYDGPASRGDDMGEREGRWSTFDGAEKASNYEAEDVESGLAGRGVNVDPSSGLPYGNRYDRSTPYQSRHEQASGWGNPELRSSRGPLPAVPGNHAVSHPEDLDAMMAESRTGYDSYLQPPSLIQRQSSLSRAASAIYATLAGGSGAASSSHNVHGSMLQKDNARFASRGSSRSAYSRQGTWNDHGAMGNHDRRDQEGDFAAGGEDESFADQSGVAGIGARSFGAGTAGLRGEHDSVHQERPLLSCVDETPRKQRLLHYSDSPDSHRQQSPTRYDHEHNTSTLQSDHHQLQIEVEDVDASDAIGAEMLSSHAYEQSQAPSTFGSASKEPIRRFTLQDNPTPFLSPLGPSNGNNKGWQPRLSSNSGDARAANGIASDNSPTPSGYDSPSVYSPSNAGHSTFPSPVPPPVSLQPGKSPKVNNNGTTAMTFSPPTASSAIQSHPYFKAYNKPASQSDSGHTRTGPAGGSGAGAAALGQSSKSGTTYSLAGVAGLLYSDGSQHQPSKQGGARITTRPLSAPGATVTGNLTDLPSSSSPRRKSMMAPNRSAGSKQITAAGAAEQENPYRAVSRVVRQSRAREGSASSSSSNEGARPDNARPEASHGNSGAWNRNVRDQLRASNSSGSSINELLHNVLGPVRSPA